MTISLESLKNSAQASLLGYVTANLAAVTVSLHAQTIVFSCYFFSEATNQDIEILRCAGTELIANFPGYVIDEVFRNITDLHRSDLLGCVFLRAEVEIPGISDARN